MDASTGSSSVLSNQVCEESSDSELKLFLRNRQSAPLRKVLALAQGYDQNIQLKPIIVIFTVLNIQCS